jgi:hypothetical protein
LIRSANQMRLSRSDQGCTPLVPWTNGVREASPVQRVEVRWSRRSGHGAYA